MAEPLVSPSSFDRAGEYVTPDEHEWEGEPVEEGSVEQDVLEEGLPASGEKCNNKVNGDQEGEYGGDVEAQVKEPVPAVVKVSPGGVHIEEEVDTRRVYLVTSGQGVSIE